ncbi:MAG TPA: SRPBCC family protein [Marmoricola sp.]|nr:SRPBCC family protein [Marmoricola sp.]
MTTIASSITVDIPASAVFDYLVEPANQVHWSPNFQFLERAPTGTLGLGTAFRGRLKNFGSLEFVYDEFQPQTSFRMAANHRTGHITHRFTLSGEGRATTVRHEVGFDARGLARVAVPLMKPMLRRMVSDLDLQLKVSLAALSPP